jgi:hypothetical protein
LEGLSGKALDRTVLSFHKSAEIIISALLPKDRYPTLSPFVFHSPPYFSILQGKKTTWNFLHLSFTFASQKTRETPK